MCRTAIPCLVAFVPGFTSILAEFLPIRPIPGLNMQLSNQHRWVVWPLPIPAISRCTGKLKHSGICRWRLFSDVKIPENTTATVYVLAKNEVNVTESGKSNSKVSMWNSWKWMVNMQSMRWIRRLPICFRRITKITAKYHSTNPIIHPADTLALMHDSVNISITSDVSEAHIYYTTDNSEPDSTSALYKAPFYITNQL